MLSGCTGQRIAFSEPPATELASVPFYPQDAYQCGPAALATVLGWSGVEVDLDTLVSRVYVPGRRGSLQPEILAAARRAGRIPYPVRADPAAPGEELAAGHPVLVLQNLGLDNMPRWHYAVMVGYDPDLKAFTLRSGTEKSRRETVQRFMSSWQRAGYWGVVVLQPGQLPASQSDPAVIARTLAESETFLDGNAAVEAWQAALARWPEQPDMLFGTGNALRRAGQTDAAARTYQTLLQRAPDHAAARNNFADLLLEISCPDEAALVLAGITAAALPASVAAAVAATQAEIEEAPRRPEAGRHCQQWRGAVDAAPADDA